MSSFVVSRDGGGGGQFGKKFLRGGGGGVHLGKSILGVMGYRLGQGQCES